MFFSLVCVSLIALSCGNSEKKTTDTYDSTTTNINNQKKDEYSKIEINIDTNSKIPDEMIGCGSTFYFNENDLKKEKRFWLDNNTSALIYINGKAENLSLKNYNQAESSYEFSNNTYLIYYRIIKSKYIGDENAKVEGIMKVKRTDGKDSLKLRFDGITGC